jgi:beta-glucosidase-like glycosyl hydrolase
MAFVCTNTFIGVGVSALQEEASEQELTTVDVVRQISDESVILLKNDNNALPLKAQSNVALFGDAQILKYQAVGSLIEQPGYIPFCSGSSYITPSSNTMVGPLDAFREFQKAGIVNIYEPLAQKYENQSKFTGKYTNDRKEEIVTEYVPTEEEYELASQFADTAIVFIRRWGGECFDYTTVKWKLTDAEETLLKTVSSKFDKVVVVLNTGTPIDMTWAHGSVEGIKVDAVLYSGYGGYHGGYGIADVIMGMVNPSGKTTSTWAKDIYDYPSTESFLADRYIQNYTEDIFVGYRYFETIPGASEKVLYPFGYGLSYTDFDISLESFLNDGETVTVNVKVTNTGDVAGKEVVQLYFGAPQKGVGEALLDKASKELCAFDKTELLQPGESEILTLSYKVDDMSSYDDYGYTGHKSAYVLEKGEYTVYFGNSVRNTAVAGTLTVDALEVVEQLSEQCPSKLTERLTHNGTFSEIYVDEEEDLVQIGGKAVIVQAENFYEINKAGEKSISGGSLYVPSTNAWIAYSGKTLGDTYHDGAYATYWINVTEAGYYDLSVRASSNDTKSNGRVSFSISGDGSEYTLLTQANVPDTFTLANTYNSTAFVNKYHNYMDIAADSAVYLEKGVQYVKLTFANAPNVDSFTLTPQSVRIFLDSDDYVAINGASYGVRNGYVLGANNTWSSVSGNYLMHLSNSGAYVIYKAEVPAEGDYKLSFRLATVAQSHNYFGISVSDAVDGTYTDVPLSLNLPNTSQLYNGTSTQFFAFIDTEAVTVHLNKGTNYIKLTGGKTSSPNFAHILIEEDSDYVRYLAKDYYELHSALKTQTKASPKIYNSGSWITSTRDVTYVANSGNTAGRYVTYKVEAAKAGKYALSLRCGNCFDNAYVSVATSTNNASYNTVINDTHIENHFALYQAATGDTTTTYKFNLLSDMALGEIELKKGTNYIRFIMPKAEGPNIESFLLTYSDESGEGSTGVEDGTGIATYKLKDVYNGVITMDQFVDQMTNYELSTFTVLHLSKSAGTIKAVRDKYGIENIILDNTPSGVMTGTCFPSETAMASTWNLTLAEAFGKCIAKEALERGYGIWEAPSVNLQRNPLGGRYNEYYSEDPFVSGTFASIVTKAVQDKGVGVCIKHFAGNEKEDGKTTGDTRVTERALREIYLEPFRIVTRYEMPWSFMSAYNKLNGVYCCQNYSLVHNILREEWGFDGFVTADWNGGTDVVQAVMAHNNMHPRTTTDQAANILQDTNRVFEAICQGLITREEIKRNAAEILNVALKTQNFIKIHIEPDGRTVTSTDTSYGLQSIPSEVQQQLASELSNELKALNIKSSKGEFAGLKLTVADVTGSFVTSNVLTQRIDCIDYESKTATLSIHNSFESADLYVMLGIYIPDGVWTRVIHEGGWTKIPAGESVTLTRDFSKIESVQGYSAKDVPSRIYTQNEFDALMYLKAPDAKEGDYLYLTGDKLSTTIASIGGVQITEVNEDILCDGAKWNISYKINGMTENAYETLSSQGIKAASGNPFTLNVLDNFIARANDNAEYTFAGWYTEDDNLISKDKLYQYVPAPGAKEQTVYACYKTNTNTIMGADFELGSSLAVNYYVKLDEAHNTATLSVTRNNNVTRLNGTLDQATGYYVFSYKGINPQCMAESIKAELVYDNTVIAVKDNYSVKRYAENMSKKSYTDLGITEEKYNKLITLLSDMLIYGDAAQDYQDYRTDNYASSGMKWLKPSTFSSPTGVRTVTGNTDSNNKVVSVGLNMGNTNKIYFRLTLTDESVKIRLDGKEISRSALKDNILYTDEIKATGFDEVHTLELIKGEEVITTLKYNVNAYIEQKHSSESVGRLVKALNNYGISAQNYK